MSGGFRRSLVRCWLSCWRSGWCRPCRRPRWMVRRCLSVISRGWSVMSVTGSVFVPIYLSEPAAAPVVVSYCTVDGTATAGVGLLAVGHAGEPADGDDPGGGGADAGQRAGADRRRGRGGRDVLGGGRRRCRVAMWWSVTTPAPRRSSTPMRCRSDNPAITVSSPTVVEGDHGQRRAQFLIHLSRPPATNVTITYATADGTAVAGWTTRRSCRARWCSRRVRSPRRSTCW